MVIEAIVEIVAEEERVDSLNDEIVVLLSEILCFSQPVLSFNCRFVIIFYTVVNRLAGTCKDSFKDCSILSSMVVDYLAVRDVSQGN